MKLTTLLFALVCLSTNIAYAQTRPAPTRATAETRTLDKNATDEEILQRADQIRYSRLYQDYSNVTVALANSTLEVTDRIPALDRLSKAYFSTQPDYVNLPENLLKADGTAMSDKEMAALVSKLTKVPATAVQTKSSSNLIACAVQFFEQVHGGDPNQLIVDGWVIIYPPAMQDVPECSAAMAFSAVAISSMGFN